MLIYLKVQFHKSDIRLSLPGAETSPGGPAGPLSPGGPAGPWSPEGQMLKNIIYDDLVFFASAEMSVPVMFI